MNSPAPAPTSTPTPQLSTSLSELAGVNVLLEGPGGTGKTHAVGTLVDAFPALQVFYTGLEPGSEALFGYWKDRGLALPPNLHYHILNQSTSDWLGALRTKAKDIGNLTQDALYKLQDMTKGTRNNYEKLLTMWMDFEDQRDGKKYGNIGSWGPDRALVVDSLTGLGEMAMQMVIGNKPVRSQTDWGIAMDNVYGLICNLTDACKCHFILLAHVEREKDELTGGTKIMTSTLGNKLSPKLPPKFSDVILTKRTGAAWSWDTADPITDLKTRNLPVASGLPPSFKPILDKWLSRGGAFSPTVKG